MQLQLTGQITGIEARNGGWFAVAFQEQGQQYAKKLSTKRAELVQQAQQMIGQWVDALYNESESTNINPNNGQPYMNRFLEAIAMAGSLPQVQQQPTFAQQPAGAQYVPPPPQFVPQPQPQAQNFAPPVQQAPSIQQSVQQVPSVRIPDELREARIMRQSAAKVSVDLLPLLAQEDQNLSSLVRIAEQLVQYFRDGVQWAVAPVQNTSNPGYPPTQEQAQQQYDDPGPQQGDPYHAPQGQALPDDDIPFAASIH